jgi:hypothetical protein
LKRTSRCFQNVEKNVLTPEGSTLKTDMCKQVFGNYGFQKKKKISPGHTWTTLYFLPVTLPEPTICKWVVNIWEICAPLAWSNGIHSSAGPITINWKDVEGSDRVRCTGAIPTSAR